MSMIARSEHVAALEERLRRFPVVALLGARQVGKTTLARQIRAWASIAQKRPSGCAGTCAPS